MNIIKILLINSKITLPNFTTDNITLTPTAMLRKDDNKLTKYRKNCNPDGRSNDNDRKETGKNDIRIIGLVV